MLLNKYQKGKVLFLYPNKEGYPGIPNGIALLSSCLKQANFETACFDTTFFFQRPETLYNREKHGGVQVVQDKTLWEENISGVEEDIPVRLLEMVECYNPNLIAVSSTDVNFTFTVHLCELVKQKYPQLPIVIGGITVTLDTDLALSHDCFDAVCVGEGEQALVDMALAVVEKRDYSSILNLCVKKNNEIIKNPLRSFCNLDNLPTQDWSIFNAVHHYKPFCGSLRRTAFVELARGCHFNCSFCCTSKLREVFKECGRYVRTRDIDKTIAEIRELKQKYDLELIFFIDDNFLGVGIERLRSFCERYKEEISLPFYLQTRPETISEEKVLLLKSAGVSTIAVGVEHGNEEYRKQFMNRKMKNEVVIRAFDIIHNHGIRSTANLILGTPYEQEEMMKDSISLFRRINPKSYSINYFAPYRGTVMRQQAIELGIIPEDYLIENSNICLGTTFFAKDRIKFYYENFAKLLSGEVS